MSGKRVSSIPGLALVLALTAQPAPAQDNNPAGVAASAQNFALFEELESRDEDDRPSRNRRNNESRATVAEPEFTLVGTSRFGDRTTLLLSHRTDRIVRVELGAQAITPIPGYENFAIVDAGAGRVAVQYPDATNCQPFLDQGVSCDSGANIATLEIITAAPLQRDDAVSDRLREALAQRAAEDEAQVEEDPDNPFAVMRARATEGRLEVQDGDGQSTRFVPRRINPEEVPPGMRVISTPFGDRLVDQ